MSDKIRAVSVRGSLILIAACFVLAQSLVLPPEGWLTGDQGSKYLQARAFAEHGPLNPSIDVLARDIDPQYVHQEPKLKNRGGRLVSEFLWLLPLVTAPFLRVLGLRGIYVVPALSVLTMFLAAAALGRRLGDGRGVRTAWMVVLSTPIVLYGLEFWEHAPAAACVMVAAVLCLPRDGEGWTAIDRRAAVRLAGAGALVATGALFREEVVAAVPALVIARGLVAPAGRVRTVIVAGAWMAVGVVLVLAAAVPVNLMIYGAPLPMHMTQDAWVIATTVPYLSVRREVIVNLFLPARSVPGYVVAAMTGLVAAMVQSWRLRTRRARPEDAISRSLLVLVHLAVIVTVGLAAGSPIWRKIHGLRQPDCYNATSAAHTWPFWVAVLYAPWYVSENRRPVARFLIVSAVLLLIGIGLLIPTDGGAQWSPRFFLAVAPLVAVVAAAGVSTLSRAFFHSADGAPGAWVRTVPVMAGAVLVASMLMQLDGVVWVRKAKMDTAGLTAAVASRTRPGEVLISNVFWFPEVTATLAPSRRMLFAWSAADVPAMAAMAVANGLRQFSIVTSVLLTKYEAPPTLDVPGAPCVFTRGAAIDLAFGLVLSPYACGDPSR